jgi:hypothetical protein
MIGEALSFARACRLLDRARRPAQIPIVVCFDVEPDARVFNRRDRSSWRGFEQLVQRIPSLREQLSQATQAPVAFTWCIRMDPQVAETWGSPDWVVKTYRDVFAELEGKGDALGLHTHVWRADSDTGGWIADHDPAWEEHCVTIALDAFETAFEKSCTVHRFGDRSLSGATLARLEAHGVKADLTVEPGMPPYDGEPSERARGLSPDYRGVPTAPYRSSRSRFPAPDPANDSATLLVPLLSAPNFKGGRSTLVLWTRANRFAARLLTELLRGPPLVLAFAVRSDASLGTDFWSTIVTNLEHLARHQGFTFITATAATDYLAPRLTGRGVQIAAGRQ